MQVILNEDINTLGLIGEVVKVKDGYARNYLFPKGLARPATPANLREIEKIKAKRQEEILKCEKHAKELAAKLEGAEVTVTVRVGEEGKLYGSVTNAEIARALSEKGLPVDKKDIHLEHGIKSVGLHEVPVKIFREHGATIKVWVVKEEENEK